MPCREFNWLKRLHYLRGTPFAVAPAECSQKEENLMFAKTVLGAAALIAVAAIGTAKADLIIVANGTRGAGQAQNEPPLNGGPGFPCATCTANPVPMVGLFDPAILVAETSGFYKFTFEGAGDAADVNSANITFTTPTGDFAAFPAGGTGPGSSPAGSSFTMFLAAGSTVPFTFNNYHDPSLPNPPICSISDGTAATPAAQCGYLLALGNSPGPSATLGPSQTTAWIGFTDGPTNQDFDYQDMTIRVDEVPEPATIALLGAGLAGLGLVRRRRAA
jgi:hypothetical protein